MRTCVQNWFLQQPFQLHWPIDPVNTLLSKLIIPSEFCVLFNCCAVSKSLPTPPWRHPKKQLKSEEKKKDSSVPSPSKAEDEEEEITVDSEPKKGNEWKHVYKVFLQTLELHWPILRRLGNFDFCFLNVQFQNLSLLPLKGLKNSQARDQIIILIVEPKNWSSVWIFRVLGSLRKSPTVIREVWIFSGTVQKINWGIFHS